MTSYPPCPDYPPYPHTVLQTAAAAVARQLGISVEDLYLPRERGDRSARFAGYTASGVHVFVKLLATEHADTRRLFEHEIEVTRALNAIDTEAFRVPKLLDHNQRDDLIWIALEYVDGDPVLLKPETLPLLSTALKAIREIGQKVIVEHRCGCIECHRPWGTERYRRNVHETLARLEALGYINGEHRRIADRFTELVAPELDDADVRDIVAKPQHGDFAPGNLRQGPRALVVLDWEHAVLDRGWLDVAHYTTTSSAWMGKLGSELARAVVSDWEVEERFLLLAQLERLSGRANDKYCRRGTRDEVTLSRLRELVTQLKRFVPKDL